MPKLDKFVVVFIDDI
jgi:hypothetical protein